MKQTWSKYAAIFVFAAWLMATLALKFEPAKTTFATAQVEDNAVLSEATDTGPRFIYETRFALEDGSVFKLQSPLAPPAALGPVCAQINTGNLTGTRRYTLTDTENCP